MSGLYPSLEDMTVGKMAKVLGDMRTCIFFRCSALPLANVLPVSYMTVLIQRNVYIHVCRRKLKLAHGM